MFCLFNICKEERDEGTPAYTYIKPQEGEHAIDPTDVLMQKGTLAQKKLFTFIDILKKEHELGCGAMGGNDGAGPRSISLGALSHQAAPAGKHPCDPL